LLLDESVFVVVAASRFFVVVYRQRRLSVGHSYDYKPAQPGVLLQLFVVVVIVG
jgi:hypothetical protein